MIGMLAWTRPAQKKAADQEITVAEITQGLRRAATGAAADGNWSAVVQATMGLARLGGLLVEKRHVQLDDQVAHLKVLKELSAESKHYWNTFTSGWWSFTVGSN